jgi:hypothetical protein
MASNNLTFVLGLLDFKNSFILEKANSIGFNSGEYGGKNKTLR